MNKEVLDEIYDELLSWCYCSRCKATIMPNSQIYRLFDRELCCNLCLKSDENLDSVTQSEALEIMGYDVSASLKYVMVAHNRILLLNHETPKSHGWQIFDRQPLKDMRVDMAFYLKKFRNFKALSPKSPGYSGMPNLEKTPAPFFQWQGSPSFMGHATSNMQGYGSFGAPNFGAKRSFEAMDENED